MKRPKLIKRVLAASLVAALVTLEGTPVMATGLEQRVETKAVTVEAVTGLAVKEQTPDGFVFSHSSVSTGATVRYDYSTNKAFDGKYAEVESFTGDTLDYDELIPGVTYYVRAYATRNDDSTGERVNGAYSNTVSVKAPVAEVTNIYTEIADTSITLEMNASYGEYSGFQISRKEGSGKYKTLTTTTNRMFKDTGLTKNTTYTYRVRAYFYNPNTKKNVYGAYAYKNLQTGKTMLNMKALPTGKTSVKLTWKKVSGAAGYDVYRRVGYSWSSTTKSGENYDFGKYKLVKSLSKKTASYTDKKLVAGESYTYSVKAFKLVKGKKEYFTEASASATTRFSFQTSVDIYKQAQDPKTGKVKIAWKQIPQAKGYLIEKRNDDGNWVTQKNITNVKTTSYTLPASPLGKTVEYRVRAYNGKKYSQADTVEVEGRLAVVTGVTAKSTKNGITVSWKAVSGASYYRVYRTPDSANNYNSDTKTYRYSNGLSVGIKVFKAVAANDSRDWYYTLGSDTAKMELDNEAAEKLAYKSPSSGYADTYKVAGTSVTDYSYAYHSPAAHDDKGVVTRENVSLSGPQDDVTYHYYVIAYKEIKNGANYDAVASYGRSKAAAASMKVAAALKTPTISKVKAGSKSATITIKKVTGAKEYMIYRSDSKKGAFKLVGRTTKLTFKDTKLTSKKTYRYKVKAVSQNGLGADKYTGYSKVKSVKVK